MKSISQWFFDIKDIKQRRLNIFAIFLLIAFLGFGLASLFITVAEPIRAAVANGVIVAWPGTNASIPSGWSRVTDLDDKYVKGTADSTNPNNTGGATTHQHTSPGHTHSISSHTHAGGTSGGGSGQGLSDLSGSRPNSNHTHTFSESGSSSGTSGSASPAWNNNSNDPSYLKIIYIESDGSPAGIPDGAIGFFNDTTPPEDWLQHVASKTRFLKGTTGDGGGTGGGAHTHTSSSHNHDNNHSHTGGASGTPSTQTANNNGVASSVTATNHTHNYSLDSGGSAPYTASSATASTDYEPPFHTLLAVENNKGSNDLPTGIIAMWLGTLSNIPVDWVLCDGLGSCTPDLRDKFVKAANLTSEVGDTGGTTGHDHTDPSTHTHSEHNHTVLFASSGNSGFTTAAGSGLSTGSHSHSAGSSGINGVTGGTTQTVDSTADTQPSFRTVAYIKCDECSPIRRVMLISYVMPFLPPIDRGVVIALLIILITSILGYFSFNALAQPVLPLPLKGISIE